MALFPHPDRIFTPRLDFEALSAELWRFQYRHNAVVQRFSKLLGKAEAEQVFMPIRFFRDHPMRVGEDWEPELRFESSGTTDQVRSQHLVKDAALYQCSLIHGFRHFYGEGDRAIFALLPSYLERQGSSLVYMVKHWIEDFGLPGSGFFLHDHAALAEALQAATAQKERILLIGVTFGLLDFAEDHALQLPADAVVMETGGMKGRRKEMVRAEVHEILKNAFGVEKIHSEYGMTELLSQGYAVGGERFRCPPWMRVVVTDPYVPGRPLPPGRTGRINVIDLANVYSCAFIQTDDLGRLAEDGSFEVLGRLDHAELRGCNLMVE